MDKIKSVWTNGSDVTAPTPLDTFIPPAANQEGALPCKIQQVASLSGEVSVCSDTCPGFH